MFATFGWISLIYFAYEQYQYSSIAQINYYTENLLQDINIQLLVSIIAKCINLLWCNKKCLQLFQTRSQHAEQPPALHPRGSWSAGASGPGTPGPDWFANKEWTAAPGALGNCHICHPERRAEAPSTSCDLIGQSYQAANSGGRATSGGDPYPARNENEKSLRETERH